MSRLLCSRVSFLLLVQCAHSSVCFASEIQVATETNKPLTAVPSPDILPTDITPLSTAAKYGFLRRETQFHILRHLPSRLWLTSSTEVSQRLETNTLFTKDHYKANYAFRTLPNILLGYNILPRSSVYCNYFVIKDLFSRFDLLNFPTTQSLSLGIRHDQPVGARTNLQLDFQARELWQTSHLRQSDLIPTLTATYAASPSLVFFTSALLQMRSGYFFQGPTRELDPFYTFGALYRRGQWIFVATNTLVTNFRSRKAIPPQSNNTMISDFEIARPVSTLPGVQSFIRAEPVWNWGSRGLPGLSGFGFRLFGGLRFNLTKPSYESTVQNIREQLQKMEN